MIDEWDPEGGLFLSGEELAMYNAASTGLANGDLMPVAEYLRSDFEINSSIRSLLADAIEGKGDFKPLKLLHRKGWRSEVSRERRARRDMAIGAFIEAEIRAFGRGVFASAVKSAAKQFRVSEGQVKASLRVFRRERETMFAILAQNAESARRDPRRAALQRMTARLYQL